MTFVQLLDLVLVDGGPAVRIDSRLVGKGDIFVAIKGSELDGHDFIAQAVSGGAGFIVCQKPVKTSNHEMIIVEDSAQAAAFLAQAAKGNPAKKLTNLAVTGTNGKTTVAFMVQAVIQAIGQKCGLMGTVVYDTTAKKQQAPLTTPDCLTIADFQSQMVSAGAKYMVTEASSHALSQNRLAGVDFKAAAFTNLTGDHLDYHKSLENYLSAKASLFEGLSGDAAAVLNRESDTSIEIAKKTSAKILWYAIDSPADISAHIKSMDAGGTTVELRYRDQSRIIKTPLLGRYNVSNLLAAAGLCLAAGFDFDSVTKGLSGFKLVQGRLQRVDWDGDFTVLIDFAHTDDALKNVLSCLKELCKGRLVVLFGCGGDRDRTKRPRMAKTVQELADIAIVSTDNPRTENPLEIISQIVGGFKNPAPEKIFVEPDRKKAIAMAVSLAKKGDIVLIAGKGHEEYQIIGKTKHDFSDSKEALEALLRLR